MSLIVERVPLQNSDTEKGLDEVIKAELKSDEIPSSPSSAGTSPDTKLPDIVLSPSSNNSSGATLITYNPDNSPKSDSVSVRGKNNPGEIISEIKEEKESKKDWTGLVITVVSILFLIVIVKKIF